MNAPSCCNVPIDEITCSSFATDTAPEAFLGIHRSRAGALRALTCPPVPAPPLHAPQSDYSAECWLSRTMSAERTTCSRRALPARYTTLDKYTVQRMMVAISTKNWISPISLPLAPARFLSSSSMHFEFSLPTLGPDYDWTSRNNKSTSSPLRDPGYRTRPPRENPASYARSADRLTQPAVDRATGRITHTPAPLDLGSALQ